MFYCAMTSERSLCCLVVAAEMLLVLLSMHQMLAGDGQPCYSKEISFLKGTACSDHYSFGQLILGNL